MILNGYLALHLITTSVTFNKGLNRNSRLNLQIMLEIGLQFLALKYYDGGTGNNTNNTQLKINKIFK